MQGGGGRGTPQQGPAAGRGTAKPARNPEERRRRVGESARWGQEAKASGVGDVNNRGSDADAGRRPPPANKTRPPANRTKPKVITYSNADNSRVSDSIQRLLSVYQSAKADKAADVKKPRMYAGRNNATKIPEVQAGPDKSYWRRTGPVQRKGSGVKDLAAQSDRVQAGKTGTVRKPTLPPEADKTELPADDVEVPEEGTKPCDEIVLLLTPDRATHSPLTQIRSFIANYLEEDSGNRCDSKNKLELFVPEASANALPVCSKRATDHIPGPDAIQPELSPSARELIIMLRRRNSEPYSPKSCVLQYPDDHPLSPACSDAWGFENYYFWERGPIRPSRPYWEVSLFKSSSALDSGAGALPSPAPGRILVNGDFGFRAALPDRVARPWDPDLRECGPAVRTVPVASRIESATRLPAPAGTATEPGDTPRRGMSKDDQYKHPAHLLVYVKPSQKKLVSLDSSRDRAGGLANRKVHKIRKIAGGASGARGTAPSKNVVFAVMSAVLLLTGGLVFFAYFLARGPALFGLAPAVPGLLRRC